MNHATGSPRHAASAAVRPARVPRPAGGLSRPDFSERITELDQALTPLVTAAAPRTLALLGVGVQHGAQLLVTIGQNLGRVHHEAAFAHLCGVSPLLASSGKTDRHRLHHGGDRQANSALHMITVVRLRYCEQTKAYMARRTAEGKTKREIMRCLKRYIAKQAYTTLTADLKDLAQPLDGL